MAMQPFINQAEALAEIQSDFPTNTTGAITAEINRGFLEQLVRTVFSRTAAAGLDAAGVTALINSLVEMGALVTNQGALLPLDHLPEGLLTEKELYEAVGNLPFDITRTIGADTQNLVAVNAFAAYSPTWPTTGTWILATVRYSGVNYVFPINRALLVGKTASGVGAAPSGANAVIFEIGDLTVSFGRTATNGLLFASNQTGAYAVTLRLMKSVIDEETRANAAEVNLGARIDGISQAASWAAVGQTIAQVAIALNALSGGQRLNYNSLRNLPTITNPASWAVAGLTIANLAASLNALTGSNRLNYNSLLNTPTIPTAPAGWADVGSVLEEGTGITVALQANGNYQIAAVAGGNPIRSHQTYLAVGADQVFTAADYTSGVSGTTGTIRTPQYTGANYLSFAYPATEPDLTSIMVLGDELRQNFLSGGNARQFTKRANVTITGTAYKVYTSIAAFSANTGRVRPTWELR